MKKAGKKSKKKPGKAPKKRTKKAPAKRAAKKAKRGAALPVLRRRVRTTPAVPGGISPELFPPEEIDRLRLIVLTSARREEKVEALRRLAYSPIDPEVKAELFLGRLADTDPEVRVEAAQILKTLGLDPEIAEAVRELEHGEEPQKLFAIDRLGRRMAQGGALDVGAGLIALIWRLREERSAAVRRQLLEKLDDAHAVITGAPERTSELVRLLVSLFAADPVDVGPPARRLVGHLGSKLPDLIRDTLWSEHDGTSARQVRVFCLQLLSGLPGAEKDGRLPEAMAGEVGRAKEHEMGFRVLGDSLMQMEDTGVRALLAAFPRAHHSQQRYIVRLVADTCRFRRVSPEAKEEVAELFVGLLAGHQREIQMTVLRTQLPADSDLRDETRGRLAEAYLTHVSLFAFPSDFDNVEHTVSRAGLASVGPLIEHLEPRSPAPERSRAARILGELAIVEGESTSLEARKSLLDILRALQRRSLDPDFPDKAVVLTAMGKVVSTAAIPSETVEIVARNLLERGLRGREDRPGEEARPQEPREPAEPEGSQRPQEPEKPEAFDYRVLEALGHLAASPHVSSSRVDEIEAIFRKQLQSELPDIPAVESEEDGVPVFSIGEEAEIYTDAVPAAVRGLAHVALGRTATRERTASVVEFFLDCWEKIVQEELDWGPPGLGALVESLRDIACGGRVDVAHKVRIVRLLARRLGQIPVIEALGCIFASEDRAVDLGRVAAAAGVALLRRKGEDGEFLEEDRESILKTLSRIAARRTLDVSTELTRHLREDIVEELFAGLRDGIDGSYDTLARLRQNENLPEEFREGVSRRLSAYESLVLA